MIINHKEWYKDFNRPLNLNQAQFYAKSCDNSLKDIVGVAIKHQLYFFRDGSADGYFIKKEMADFFSYILNRYLSSVHILNDSNKNILKQCKDIERFFYSFKNIDFLKLSNREIRSIFNESMKVLNRNVAAIWVGFFVDRPLVQKMSKILDKYGIQKEEALKVIGSLDKSNHIIQEQLDLMNIVIRNSDRKKAIKKHYEKYSYIPCYSAAADPYDISYFENRIKNVNASVAKDMSREIKENLRQNAKNYKKFLDDNLFNKEDLAFVHYFHSFYFFKDFRSHYRSWAMFNYGKLLSAIARRYGLKLSQLLLLLQDEINELLSHRFITSSVSKAISKRDRKNFYYVYFDNNEEIVYRQLIPHYNYKKQVELFGTSVSMGKVSGSVKIVMSPNDVNKVNKGDILVSPMTRPDYIMAMKRASAIITDEGGTLCHAAIVSREIKKPCIVGTKNATQVLKDGDKVEVDANNGIIKKL